MAATTTASTFFGSGGGYDHNVVGKKCWIRCRILLEETTTITTTADDDDDDNQDTTTTAVYEMVGGTIQEFIFRAETKTTKATTITTTRAKLDDNTMDHRMERQKDEEEEVDKIVYEWFHVIRLDDNGGIRKIDLDSEDKAGNISWTNPSNPEEMMMEPANAVAASWVVDSPIVAVKNPNSILPPSNTRKKKRAVVNTKQPKNKSEQPKPKKKKKAEVLGEFGPEIVNRHCMISYIHQDGSKDWYKGCICKHVIERNKHWHFVHFEDGDKQWLFLNSKDEGIRWI
jgi:hypothetical protein